MNTILTVQDFITELIQTPKGDYTSILEKLIHNKDLFKNYQSWSEKRYTRNCIYRNDDFELILLCWQKGQQTKIHNHGGEECWLYVIEGEIKEHNFILNNDSSVTLVNEDALGPDQVSYINDKIGLHRLGNSYNGRTISLHLYAKPIDRCDYYCDNQQDFVSKELSYDTYKSIEKTSV